MNAGTLKDWMKTATHEQKRVLRKAVKVADFTPAERLLALNETHGMSEEARNGWCRKRGVFAHDLARWHEAFCGAETPANRREESAELRPLRLANAQLQRDVNRHVLQRFSKCGSKPSTTANYAPIPVRSRCV
ncbi:MAG: transposase [Acidiferrobacteraceae bacterium]